MRQHEDGRVIRRLVAPPAFPAVVRPRAADGTKHVATENPGADSAKALLCDSVVDSGFSIVVAVHRSPDAGVEKPFHQLGAAYAERILEILVRPDTVAIDGNREALDAEFRHRMSGAHDVVTTGLSVVDVRGSYSCALNIVVAAV